MARLPGTPTAPPSSGFLRHGRRWQTLEEHDAAADAINLATFKRIYHETMTAAFREASDAPDPAAARKIFDQASSRVSTIDSPNPRVQQEYAAHYEGSQAIWDDRFARQAQGIKDKNLFEQSEQNIQGYIQAGDQEGAAKELVIQSTAFPELQAKNEYRIQQLPVTSTLYGIRGAIADGDYARAKTLMGEAQGLSLTVEQKEDLAKMEGAVNRAAKEQAGFAQVDLLIAANKAAALPAAERYAEIERIKVALAPLLRGRPPEETRATMNWLDAIARGEAFKTDPIAELEANAIINSLNADSTVREIAAAREGILALQSRLGAKVVGYIEELDTRLDGMTTNAIAYAVDDAVAKRRLDPAFEPVMRRELEKWVNAQKADVAPSAIIKRGAEIGVMGPAPRPEAGVFTPGAIQKAIGWLMATETETPGDLAEAMVNEMRVRFGPRWREDAPLAERFIKRRAPLNSWHFQTDDEKIATLDRVRNLDPSFWQIFGFVEADIDYRDVQMARRSAPLSKKVTPAMVKAFGKYLDGTDKMLPKPEPEEVVVPMVTTQAEYDALPSGTIYIAPDGKKRTKQ